jgi:hypothetical protein
MRHNEAIVEIFDGGQISPALLGADLGNIGDPLLVRLGSDKVTVEHIWVAMVGANFFQFFVQFWLSGLGTNAQLAH